MNATDAQRYARIAGVLLLVSLIAGGFGESYAPDKLFSAASAAETAHHIAASVGFFRAGFAAYMVEAMCDLSLTAIFYLLLRPVSRPLALIAFCFGLFGTATFATGEILYFAAGLPIIDADVARELSPHAALALSYMGFTVYGYIFAIFSAFYGVETAIRGYLVFGSGYLPRWIGVLLVIAGAGFVIKNFLAVLAPQHDSMLLVAPTLLAMLSFGIWLLAKGVDRERWQLATGTSGL